MRVALLEGRMSGEMAALGRRHGGVSAPAVCERQLPGGAQVAELIGAFADEAVDLVVFLTGAGVRALVEAAAIAWRSSLQGSGG